MWADPQQVAAAMFKTVGLDDHGAIEKEQFEACAEMLVPACATEIFSKMQTPQ